MLKHTYRCPRVLTNTRFISAEAYIQVSSCASVLTNTRFISAEAYIQVSSCAHKYKVHKC